jgi:hypothetical protein
MTLSLTYVVIIHLETELSVHLLCVSLFTYEISQISGTMSNIQQP